MLQALAGTQSLSENEMKTGRLLVLAPQQVHTFRGHEREIWSIIKERIRQILTWGLLQ